MIRRVRIEKFDFLDGNYLCLDVGCGPEVRQGHLGLDLLDYGQSIVWNVEQGVPLPDNSCAEIFCQHTIEHLTDLVGVMKEFWRVLLHDGKLTIIAPHKNNARALAPSHVRLVDDETIRCFERDGTWKILELFINDRPDVVAILKPVK